MSDQEGGEDEKRAKQLEEARKRVEELKKKNKKDKKSKKKQAKVNSDKDNDNGSQSENQGGDSELLEDKTSPADEIQGQEPSAEKKNNETTAGVIPINSPEVDTHLETEKLDVKNTDENDARNEVEIGIIDERKNSVSETTPSPSNDASQLFGGEDDNEQDFMSTIKKENDQDEVEKLKAQLENTTSECKKLKFISMEQETTIEELQAEVEQLTVQLRKSQQELQTVNEKLKETEINLSEAQQLVKSPVAGDSARLQFAQFNSPNIMGQRSFDDGYFDRPENRLNIDRDALNKWRNWNVDMTAWRSIGAGPIVEF